MKQDKENERDEKGALANALKKLDEIARFGQSPYGSSRFADKEVVALDWHIKEQARVIEDQRTRIADLGERLLGLTAVTKTVDALRKVSDA